MAANPEPDLRARNERWLVWAVLAYALLVVALMVGGGLLITPDVLLVAFLLVAVLLGRTRLFLRDWIPFVAIFLAYELMRGIADDAGFPVHVTDVIAAERLIAFGHLPTQLLQEWLAPPRGVGPAAIVATVLYMLHFALPIMAGLLLWVRRRPRYYDYVAAFIALSFAGFVTYLLLPVAPPWWRACMFEVPDGYPAGPSTQEPLVAQTTARAAASRHDSDDLKGDLSAWTDGLLLGGALLYGGFVGLLTVVRDVPVTPDVMLVAAMLLAVMALRRWVAALRDWTPFLVLFLAYELMRGLADDVGMPVHVGDVARFERSLFGGQLPTALLQGWLHPATGTDWLAVLGTVVYYFHFVVPVLTAFLLWRYRHLLFHPYLISLILLSFAGFVTYLLLPVAPPWYAAAAGQIGALPGEPAIMDLKLHAFSSVMGGIGLDGESLYDVAFLALSANPVAAFPSLHAALAFLSFLVLRRAFGAAGWAGFAYFLAVAFTIVYTADHYVVDVIAGVSYATGAYVLMWMVIRRVTGISQRSAAVPEPG